LDYTALPDLSQPNCERQTYPIITQIDGDINFISNYFSHIRDLVESWDLFKSGIFRFTINFYITFNYKNNKKDLLVGTLSPLFLLARTLSYVCGFSKGLIDYLIGIQTAKKSAGK
jgi:hypothetical protein